MSRARVSSYAVEVLHVYPGAPSPTTVTGAGVSQYLIEALHSATTTARMSQYAVEVLMTEDENQSSPVTGSSPSTRAYGHAT